MLKQRRNQSTAEPEAMSIMEPLLHKDCMSSQQVLFSIPNNWPDNGGGICYINCKADCIEIVETETNKVLDTVDLEDLIGVSLTINALNNERTLESNDSNRAYNEPPTDNLNDTTGFATLTLSLCPRNSKQSLVSCISNLFKTRNSKIRRHVPHSRYSVTGPRHLEQLVLTVQPCEDLMYIQQLCSALRKLANATTSRRFLIIINPKSGPGKARQTWQQTVQPMFDMAHIDYTFMETTRSQQAKERMQQTNNDQDVSNFDGVILLGGDGLIHEVFNGLYTRSDCQALVGNGKLKIGIIGCGSCNGYPTTIAKASGEEYGPISETYLIIKNRTTQTDASLYQTSGKSYISHLTFNWGICSDIDIESEVLRWMGELRVHVWAVWRVLFLRRYHGKLHYLPCSETSSNMPSLDQPINGSEYKSIDDTILLLWACQASYVSMSVYTSPNSKLHDGVFQLMLVRNVSRLRMALILLALDSGAHVNMNGVEFIQCTAYRFEPDANEHQSFNNIDGEVVESGPVQGRVIPNFAHVYCKPQS